MLQNKLVKIKKAAEEGFTLIELLVVIGILAILMGIVLIAINPAHQFALANDTNRRNAVAQILSAVGQYEAENKGTLPPGLSTSMAATEIAGPTGAGKVDLCTILVGSTPQYLPALPSDPKVQPFSGASFGADIPTGNCASYDSGYQVAVDANNRVTISAPKFEAAATIIQVTR